MGKKRKQVRIFLVAICFLLPFLVLYSLFTIWPVIQGFYVSLHKWTLMGKQEFIGFENYLDFMGDKSFWGALKNTFKFVLITCPMLVVVALLLALLANRPTRMKKSLRIIYYMPSILSVSIASLIAGSVFAPYKGLLNGILVWAGIIKAGEDLQFLMDKNLVWVTISTMTVWWTVGFSMLLFISALQEISPEMYEAAEIDGATKSQQLWGIVLPLLKPTTWLVILLQTLACFKVFGQVYNITGGGPANSTRPIIQ
jgi:multiple sugar transport system permease protein